jgi:hypothetical protein
MSDPLFIYRAEMDATEIPGEVLSSEALGATPFSRSEYLNLPVAAWHLFPPAQRLLLVVLWALSVFGEDDPGGWVRLSHGKYTRAGLGDRYARLRAVRALERHPEIEVDRSAGRVTRLRLRDPKAFGIRARRSKSSTRRGRTVPAPQANVLPEILTCP